MKIVMRYPIKEFKELEELKITKFNDKIIK